MSHQIDNINKKIEIIKKSNGNAGVEKVQLQKLKVHKGAQETI